MCFQWMFSQTANLLLHTSDWLIPAPWNLTPRFFFNQSGAWSSAGWTSHLSPSVPIFAPLLYTPNSLLYGSLPLPWLALSLFANRRKQTWPLWQPSFFQKKAQGLQRLHQITDAATEKRKRTEDREISSCSGSSHSKPHLMCCGAQRRGSSAMRRRRWNDLSNSNCRGVRGVRGLRGFRSLSHLRSPAPRYWKLL